MKLTEKKLSRRMETLLFNHDARLKNIHVPPSGLLEIFYKYKREDDQFILFDDDHYLYMSKIILGQAGSGKSSTARRCMEELMRYGIPLLIFDFTGEHTALKEINPHAIILKTSNELKTLYPEMLESLGATYIIDFTEFDFRKRTEVMKVSTELLFNIFSSRLESKKLNTNLPPLEIFIEEAQNFLPEAMSGVSDKETKQAIQAISKAFVDLAIQGRKYGIGLTAISQRSTFIKKSFIAQCRYKFFHRVDTARDKIVYWEESPPIKSHHGVLGFREFENKIISLKAGECLFIDQTNTPQFRRIRKHISPTGRGRTQGLGILWGSEKL